MPTINYVLNQASKYLDPRYTEGPRTNETPFGEWCGYPLQAWCMSFVSNMLHSAGLPIGKIAYVPSGVLYFKREQRLYAQPKIGDVFFLYFPSLGRYAHAGFVRDVQGDWIITVEGNSNTAGSRTGGSVVSMKRKWMGTRTVFGRPTYSTDKPRPQLKQGAKGDDVKFLQSSLGIKADGDWGPITQAAVIHFQQTHGLAVDGVVGPLTWKALAG